MFEAKDVNLYTYVLKYGFEAICIYWNYDIVLFKVLPLTNAEAVIEQLNIFNDVKFRFVKVNGIIQHDLIALTKKQGKDKYMYMECTNGLREEE